MSFLDLSNVEATGGDFEPVPKGMYKVIVEDAEIKDTKAGTGQYISVKFNVMEGEFEGRKIFVMYNIKNPSEVAVKVGLGQLKALLMAANVSSLQLNDVSELFGLIVMAKVDIKDEKEYGKKNVIKAYSLYEGPVDESISADTVPF